MTFEPMYQLSAIKPSGKDLITGFVFWIKDALIAAPFPPRNGSRFGGSSLRNVKKSAWSLTFFVSPLWGGSAPLPTHFISFRSLPPPLPSYRFRILQTSYVCQRPTGVCSIPLSAGRVETRLRYAQLPNSIYGDIPMGVHPKLIVFEDLS